MWWGDVTTFWRAFCVFSRGCTRATSYSALLMTPWRKDVSLQEEKYCCNGSRHIFLRHGRAFKHNFFIRWHFLITSLHILTSNGNQSSYFDVKRYYFPYCTSAIRKNTALLADLKDFVGKVLKTTNIWNKICGFRATSMRVYKVDKVHSLFGWYSRF